GKATFCGNVKLTPPSIFQVFVVAAGSNSGTFIELMFRNSMNSSAVSSSSVPTAIGARYMISLMTIGPTSGYGLGAPVPVRNWATLVGVSTPNERRLIATNSTAPALLVYRPNDTPLAAAPNFATAR